MLPPAPALEKIGQDSKHGEHRGDEAELDGRPASIVGNRAFPALVAGPDRHDGNGSFLSTIAAISRWLPFAGTGWRGNLGWISIARPIKNAWRKS